MAGNPVIGNDRNRRCRGQDSWTAAGDETTVTAQARRASGHARIRGEVFSTFSANWADISPLTGLPLGLFYLAGIVSGVAMVARPVWDGFIQANGDEFVNRIVEAGKSQ